MLAGRDALGRFTGAGGYGADAEAQGLEQYAADTGRDVISDQVRSTLPDGSIRYYDDCPRMRMAPTKESRSRAVPLA